MKPFCLSPGRFILGAYLCASATTAHALPLVLNEIIADNATGLRDGDGGREDWIEIANPNPVAVSLEGFSLTDDLTEPRKWVFPAGAEIAGNGYLVVFASGDGVPDGGGMLHTNFRLAADGETLALFATDGETVESAFSPEFPRQFSDISYGLPAAGGDPQFFEEPTPGAANTKPGFAGVVRDTVFSVDRGFYESPFTVEIRSRTEGAEIRYTLDGSEPTATGGTVYSDPIEISGTSTLRAVAVKPDFLSTDVDTHTYIFVDQVVDQPDDPPGWPDNWGTDGEVGGTVTSDYEMDPRVKAGAVPGYSVREALLDIPTMSLVLEQDDFTGRTGIYTNPTDRGSRWEKEASLELIYPDGRRGFQENCELEIHGNSSRRPFRMQKHSMRVTFRSDIGASKLRFPLFEGTDVDSFNKLVLRACFTDSWGLATWSDARYRPNDSQYIRDVWMKESQKEMGHLSGTGNFVHLYVNGLYFGLFNPTERIEEDFFVEHFGGEPEDWEVYADFQSPGRLWQTVQTTSRRSMSDPANYQRMTELIDIDNFIDYMLLHFYGDSEDWGEKNGYAGANRNPANGDTKYRFYVWDQEIALDKFTWNPYNQVGTGGGSDSPSDIFTRLRRNDDFVRRFGDRVQKHLFAGGALSEEASKERYLRIAGEIDKAIVAESARWGDTVGQIHRKGGRSGSYPSIIRNPRRPGNPDDDYYPPVLDGDSRETYYFTRENSWLVERDNIVEHYIPTLHDLSGSTAIINELRRENLFPDTDAPVFNQPGGDVSRGFSLTVTATEPVYITTDGSDPAGAGGGPGATATLLSGPLTITDSVSVLARARNAATNEWSALTGGFFNTADLQVSEIHYHPAEGPTAEFIELTNSGAGSIDLTGAQFTRGIDFVFAEGGPVTSLGPDERLLVVNDLAGFRAIHGNTHDARIAGTFANGTSLDRGGETLELTTATGDVLFSFRYNDKSPWPESPDGGGSSLVFRGAGDPGDPINWRPSAASGGNPATSDASVFPGGDAAALLAYATGGPVEITRDGVAVILEVPLRVSADDAVVTPQMSSELGDWDPGAAGSFSFLGYGTPDARGFATARYRCPLPVPTPERLFFRFLIGEQ